MPLLPNATIKLARARKHYAELETVMTAFAGGVRFDTRVVNIAGQPHQAFLNFHIPPPSENFGGIIGDVIHNLRSALDLLACDLVRAKEGAQANVENVHFPFCKSADDLEYMIKKREFDRAGDHAIALLREMKPYHNGNAALRVLHDLDIRDKHQSLISAETNIASPVLSRWDDDGTPNLSIVGDAAKASDIRLTFAKDCPLAGNEVLPSLKSLVELTAGVIEAFSTLTG